MCTNRNFICLLLCGTVFSAAATANESPFARDLQRAYNANDKQVLDSLVLSWAKDSETIMTNRKGSSLEIVADVETIFVEVVRSHLDAPRNTYFIVPSSIDVLVTSAPGAGVNLSTGNERTAAEWLKHSDRLVLRNFGPRNLMKFKHVLILDIEHEEDLLRFVSGVPDARIEDRWELSNKSEESKKRIRFLASTFAITPGHFGKGWQWETGPCVDLVTFNENIDMAHVLVRNGHGSEIWLFKKMAGQWIRNPDPVLQIVE